MKRSMVVLGLVVLVVLAASPRTARAQSLQEVLLRAKPAVALVVSEVAARVTVNCGGVVTTVEPAPLRETGTGWFVSPSGWLVTNAHVVSPAHRPPDWLNAEMAKSATRPGCRATDVKLEPAISVVLSNGIRMPATIAKYSPPIAGEGMSGRDLALLRLDAADLPALTLGDSGALQIGDPVHIIGFPGVVLTHELLNASAKVEASITNGAVSGFKQDKSGQPVIQTDASAAGGAGGEGLSRGHGGEARRAQSLQSCVAGRPQRLFRRQPLPRRQRPRRSQPPDAGTAGRHARHSRERREGQPSTTPTLPVDPRRRQCDPGRSRRL